MSAYTFPISRHDFVSFANFCSIHPHLSATPTRIHPAITNILSNQAYRKSQGDADRVNL